MRFKFFSLLLLTQGFWLFMKQMTSPLDAKNIIDLETARTVERAEGLISWFQENPPLMEMAIRSVYLDFIFILFYVAFLAVAVRWLGSLSGLDLLQRTGKFFLFIILAAGVSDIIENIFLLKVLGGELTELNVRMAYNFAAAKFSMIIMVLLLLVVNLVFMVANIFNRRISVE